MGDLRMKINRNQDERRRSDIYRGDRQESGWDLKGKGSSINYDLYCFKCNKSGHFQKDCKNSPYCFYCRKDGHKSSMCPEKKGLRVCGIGLPGQGFYSIRVPVKERAKKGARGVLTMLQGSANIGMVRAELRAFYRENADWEISMMVKDKEFMIIFPDDDKRS